MNKTLPFIQATKIYLSAVRSIELTQYKRAKKGEREKITIRNKELNKLGFGLPEINKQHWSYGPGAAQSAEIASGII